MVMKFYTHDEMLDKHVGIRGTSARDNFDAEVEAALIGASIKEVPKISYNKIPPQRLE